MNVIVTYKCGNRFQGAQERDGAALPCPECGKTPRVKRLASAIVE